jgi:hypothetical protein
MNPDFGGLDELLDAALRQYRPIVAARGDHDDRAVFDLPAVAQLRSLDPTIRAEAASRLVERIAHCAADDDGLTINWHDQDWVGSRLYKSMANLMLASKLPLTSDQLCRMLRASAKSAKRWGDFFVPLTRITGSLERFAEFDGVAPELQEAAMSLRDCLDDPYNAKSRSRIDRALCKAAAQQRTTQITHDPNAEPADRSAEEAAAALMREFLDGCAPRRPLTHRSLAPVFIRIKALSVAAQIAFVRIGFDRIASISREAAHEQRRFLYLLSFSHTTPWAGSLSDCLAALLDRKLPIGQADLTSCVDACAEYGVVSGSLMPHIRALCRAVKRCCAEATPSSALEAAIGRLAAAAGSMPQATERKIKSELLSLVQRSLLYPINPGEAWSDRAIEDLKSMPAPMRREWVLLLAHCASATGSAPAAKWRTSAGALLGPIGHAAFVSRTSHWFNLVDKPRTTERRRANEWEPDATHLIDDTHADILKGLCWTAATIESPDLARALGRLALSCYRKVPGVGPRAVKVGNAAIYALGRMPGRDSLAQLAMLRVKVKFGTAQKMLEKALAAAAEREGMPREEIEELAVPAYGLTEVGLREEPLGDFTAVLRVERSGKSELVFRKPDGKSQKSVPAALKESHADDLKELKAAAKDIGAMLPAQRERLDALFLQDKTWDLATWRERYLDHPLVGVIARRLIWRFAPAKAGGWDPAAPARSAIWLDGTGLTGLDGQPLAPAETDRVRLWHPIEVPQEEILAWRDFLEAREIVQPFKQAHREVYLLTDAERNTQVYSNRYAAHILRQHQCNALMAARNWKNKLRLMVDDEFPPAARLLPAWGLRAEFWIEGIGEEYGEHTNEAGVYNHVATDQVRFYRRNTPQNTAHAYGGRYGMFDVDAPLNQPLPLESIPPLVFSEIMRDVDLFVGVASVGNNPAWQDGGPAGEHRDYWWSYSFGDLSGTAETRRDILARLVPRLKIADRCSIDGKFLRVRGDMRTYKIHVGSGNILMEPNDQYLCIVPGRSDPALPEKLYLPFEGDRTLAIILSKAFLLADDKKITDSTITSQIRRA